MNHQNTISSLILGIAILSAIAAPAGIFSSGGPGPFEFESIRGEAVTIYGYGIYRHMSANVAPQGIAQDYITLFVAIPLLLISFLWARKSSLKGRFLLAGTLFYFFVTYLFYLVMAMYNAFFMVYSALFGLSFFAFIMVLLSFDTGQLPDRFSDKTPVKLTGGFLMFNAVAIAFLWLSIVVPPLLDGTIIPKETEHYTTLIVQGLDLGLLLPLSFISGFLFIRKNSTGYLLAPVYFVFLSIMMTALVAKIIAMGILDQNIVPVIFIIPAILMSSVLCAWSVFRNIIETFPEEALQ